MRQRPHRSRLMATLQAAVISLALVACSDEWSTTSPQDKSLSDLGDERCKPAADAEGSPQVGDDELRRLLEGNRIVECTPVGSPFSGEYFHCDGTWTGFVVGADIWNYDGHWTMQPGGQLCVKLVEPSPDSGTQEFCRSVRYGPNRDKVFVSDFLPILRPRAETSEPRWLMLEPLKPKAR